MSSSEYEVCPGCSHPLTEKVHDPEDGCLEGWEWDESGLSIVTGCRCDLTVAGQHR